MTDPTKPQPRLTAAQQTELARLNKIADEASARGDHKAAVAAGHKANRDVRGIAKLYLARQSLARKEP